MIGAPGEAAGLGPADGMAGGCDEGPAGISRLGRLGEAPGAGSECSSEHPGPWPSPLLAYGLTPLGNFVLYPALTFAPFSNPARARSFPSRSQAEGST